MTKKQTKDVKVVPSSGNHSQTDEKQGKVSSTLADGDIVSIHMRVRIVQPRIKRVFDCERLRDKRYYEDLLARRKGGYKDPYLALVELVDVTREEQG